jgi:hypothetical protein
LDDVGVVADPGTISISNSRVSKEAVTMLAPEIGWAIETSPGNFQVGWRIEVEHDLARWDHFIRSMSQHKLFGAGVHDVVHYFRMETGSGKPEKGKFQTRLAKAWDGHIWKLDDLAAKFGVDMSLAGESSRTAPANSTLPSVSPELGREIIQRLPNRSRDHWFEDRNDWIGVAHALRNACGETDGRDLWLEWNGMRPQVPASEPERVWDTLPPDSANNLDTLRWWLIKIHGETSKTFSTIKQRIADEQAPLTVIEDAEAIPMPETKETETAKAAKKFKTLLREIAKTQPVPDHHKANGSNHDEHWLPNGGGLLDLGVLTGASLPVAPPVIYEPFVRGVLAVVGGAPSIGKSNLILNQALAVVADRGDLLRHGVKLQFAGDVIYVSNEDGLSVLQRRAIAWATYHKVDLTKTPYRLIPVRTTMFRKNADETWAADCIPVLERILEHGKTGRRIAMVVVDTLATSVTGINENQTVDISPAMKLFQDVATALWCSVPFLHHTTKEAWARGSADTTIRSIATIRGSGGITGTYTRGATLIVAPNKLELDTYPDWAKQDIVVEFMAKANDGPENFVAGYYKRVLVDVEQVSAVDPLVLELRKEPVLVPFQPMLFGSDTVLMDGYEAALRAHPGEVRVVEKLGPNGSPNSVQTVLGVTNSVAKTIVEGLTGAGRAEIKVKKDQNSRVYSVLEWFEGHNTTSQQDDMML